MQSFSIVKAVGPHPDKLKDCKETKIEYASAVLRIQTPTICSDVSSCLMCHSKLEHPNTHGSAIAMEHQGHEDSPLKVKAVGPHPDKLKEVDYYELLV